MSNILCNTVLNASFSIAAVALKWSQLVDLAKAKRSETEEQFRAVLFDRGVSSATITNWKGGRPIPIARYPLFSELLTVSIDELHGKKPVSGVRESTLIYSNSDRDAKFLAAEIAQLDSDEREMLTTMVNVLVAKKKKAEQAIKSGKSPSKPKGKPTRPNA